MLSFYSIYIYSNINFYEYYSHKYTYALYFTYIYNLHLHDSIILDTFPIDLYINYNQCNVIESVKSLYIILEYKIFIV